jgi:hypothetical protein
MACKLLDIQRGGKVDQTYDSSNTTEAVDTNLQEKLSIWRNDALKQSRFTEVGSFIPWEWPLCEFLWY